ncbi:hypothetical protein N0V94_007664 [Neodidymelliopsis sp. IMI 364377]|nr:hypothetical protein N0V94_007664 [Neodidymelliopsis sp. IMI 364377]
MVMMLPYADIDLNDSPIVVLGCKGRHFFTTETLDGIMGMNDVYEIDARTGEYSALKEDAQLTASVPQCPMCREPVRQYVTQRYNRVVNRAVIDEMSKRFVVSGQQELQALEKNLQTVGEDLEKSRSALLPVTGVTYDNTFRENNAAQSVAKKLNTRYVDASHLEMEVRSFLRKTDQKHKPSHKLHDAIAHAARKQLDINDALERMSLGSVATSIKQDGDQRITLAGRLYHLKVRQLVLDDKFEVLEAFGALFSTATLDFPGGLPVDRSRAFLHDCLELIKDCKQAHSPKLAVEASLYYAHITRLLSSWGLTKETERPKIMQYRESAIGLLKEAEKLCESAFQGRDHLKEGIERSLELLGREFYQVVTKEEIEAIKRAMFAIGECGMPMQLARCPECGAAVGGRNHEAVAGVTRAENMED